MVALKIVLAQKVLLPKKKEEERVEEKS